MNARILRAHQRRQEHLAEVAREQRWQEQGQDLEVAHRGQDDSQHPQGQGQGQAEAEAEAEAEAAVIDSANQGVGEVGTPDTVHAGEGLPLGTCPATAATPMDLDHLERGRHFSPSSMQDALDHGSDNKDEGEDGDHDMDSATQSPNWQMHSRADSFAAVASGDVNLVDSSAYKYGAAGQDDGYGHSFSGANNSDSSASGGGSGGRTSSAGFSLADQSDSSHSQRRERLSNERAHSSRNALIADAEEAVAVQNQYLGHGLVNTLLLPTPPPPNPPSQTHMEYVSISQKDGHGVILTPERE